MMNLIYVPFDSTQGLSPHDPARGLSESNGLPNGIGNLWLYF